MYKNAFQVGKNFEMIRNTIPLKININSFLFFLANHIKVYATLNKKTEIRVT